MNIIEEIKNRITIFQLLQQFGIKPNNQGFIHSIYKQEQNPSLKIYPDKNSFFCYATYKGGDVINFYADYKKISNSEAIKILATDLGIIKNNSVGVNKIDEEKINTDKEIKENIIDPISEQKYYEIYHSLKTYNNEIKDEAYKYLTGPKRGLTDETIKKFNIFSINEVQCTIDHLMKNFEMDDLKDSGLFNKDRRFVFSKHNLIIPFMEGDQIVYLRGRYIPENGNDIDNKYIGLYGKQAKRLFNINSIKNLTEESDILLCEGEFDAIRAEQEGIKAIGIPGVNNFPEDSKELFSKIKYLFVLIMILRVKMECRK